jgi:hypothetical protein
MASGEATGWAARELDWQRQHHAGRRGVAPPAPSSAPAGTDALRRNVTSDPVEPTLDERLDADLEAKLARERSEILLPLHAADLETLSEDELRFLADYHDGKVAAAIGELERRGITI